MECDCECQKKKLAEALAKMSPDSVDRWERTIQITRLSFPIKYYYPAKNPVAKIFFETMAACIEEADSIEQPLSLTTRTHRVQMIYTDRD